MRARGLKQKIGTEIDRLASVAPHAGAWIETLHWAISVAG